MEKPIEKKETSKVDVKNVVEYVKLAEMTGKDILALPRFNGELVKTKSKRGQIYYKLVVELDHLLKIERPITPTEFNLIVLERKLSFDVPIQHVIIPVRLLEGKSVSGRDWKRYEFFVSKSYVANSFLSEHEVALINAGKIKLDFIKSDEKYNDDVVNAFNDDDFLQ